MQTEGGFQETATLTALLILHYLGGEKRGASADLRKERKQQLNLEPVRRPVERPFVLVLQQAGLGGAAEVVPVQDVADPGDVRGGSEEMRVPLERRRAPV